MIMNSRLFPFVEPDIQERYMEKGHAEPKHISMRISKWLISLHDNTDL